jgi:hypothetical protein
MAKGKTAKVKSARAAGKKPHDQPDQATAMQPTIAIKKKPPNYKRSIY